MINRMKHLILKRYFFLIILSAMASALLSVQSLSGWLWNGVALIEQPVKNVAHAVFLPEDKSLGKVQDCFKFVENSLAVRRCDKSSEMHQWRSPDSWRVQEVFYSDLNRDGTREFAILVWRSFQPWPIDKYLPLGGRINSHQDSHGMSCHLILIGWDGQEYRELWAGSALAAPLTEIQFGDVDGDQYMELLAIENEYDGLGSGNLVVWKWQGFGFTLLDRVEGKFRNYSINQTKNGLMIITN